ncbi:hypothetical protein ACQZD5_000285 [Klebsiella aerogenes]
MTSKLTREELINIIETDHVQCGEASALARMALAAMDSEPYGYVNQFLYEQNGVSGLSNDHEYYHDSKSHIPLYRHAQPAPVVQKDHQIRELVNQLRDIAIEYHGTQQLRERIARALRAAMLQAEPVTTANKLGNSPVIPDGSEHCPCCGKKLRRACSVEGCEGKHVAHGLCKKHYDMKRWEDPEQVRKFREAGKRYRRKTKSAAAAPQEVNSWSSHHLPVTRGDAVGCPFNREEEP